MNEKMSAATNVLNWFEIPATDMPRAKKFYESILAVELFEMQMHDMEYAMFPSNPGNGKLAGALAKSEMHQPGSTGSIVYLNANPNLQHVLDRIEAAGGKITLPKTSIGQNGFMAFFIDTEGNSIGLHSNE